MVGLGCFLGLSDLVHQVLHLARQDYVPNTNRGDLQTQLTSTLTNRLLDLLANRVLANQEGIEFACADDGPQCQLRLAVQRLTNVVRRANCLASIDNAVGDVGVDAQCDLVSRHDLLTADVSRGLTLIDFDNAGVGRSLPEGILTRRQRIDIPAVNEQHTDAIALDVADVERQLGTLAADDDAQVLVIEPDLPRINDLNPNFLLASPVGVQARRQDVAEAAVNPNERPLMVLQVKD